VIQIPDHHHCNDREDEVSGPLRQRGMRVMSAPVYPDHDGEAGFARQATRAGDVQVETFGLYLLQVLRRGLSTGKGKQLLFDGSAFWLRADGPAGDERALNRTVTRTESETYPWRVASVEERKEVKSFDWRKRAGIVAYLMPRY